VSATTLYLVRHAHAHWTPDDNRPLSDEGTLAAGRLAVLLSESPITAIYSSPSRRAFDTVAPLSERLGQTIEVVADFRERDLPTARMSQQEFDRLAEESWRFPNEARVGRESNAVAQRRGLTALMSLLDRHRGQHLVVSTHGTLMALIMNGLDSSLGFEFWCGLSFPDVYALDFTGGGFTGMRRLWTGQ
jgi:2,3-bisphosphoglycerate-dependent phosphoglycerate mutase